MTKELQLIQTVINNTLTNEMRKVCKQHCDPDVDDITTIRLTCDDCPLNMFLHRVNEVFKLNL